MLPFFFINNTTHPYQTRNQYYSWITVKLKTCKSLIYGNRRKDWFYVLIRDLIIFIETLNDFVFFFLSFEEKKRGHYLGCILDPIKEKQCFLVNELKKQKMLVVAAKLFFCQ